MGSVAQGVGVAGANVCGTQTASWLEDSDLLQEQTQSICEELQRRGACTTLVLARHLGFEKSSAVNPLMFLLLEKNVVVRVSDIPPIWSLSPTFPMSRQFDSNQLLLSPQPPSPLTAGFPPSFSRASPTFQSPPILSILASSIPTPGPTAIPAASTALVLNPCSAPTLISTPTSEIPAQAVFATPVVTPAPCPSPGRIVMPTVTPAPAPSPTSAPISSPTLVISSPTPAPGATSFVTQLLPLSPAPPHISTHDSLTPDSTPVASTPDPSQVPTPEFVISRSAMTFSDHVIPTTEEESEDEDKQEVADKATVEKTSPKAPLPALTFTEHLIPETTEKSGVLVVEKTSPKAPLPALTFTEHLIPDTTEENKVIVVEDSHSNIRPRLPIPTSTSSKHIFPIAPPTHAVVHEYKHEQRYGETHSRGRNPENGQRYRYFHGPTQDEYRGSYSSYKRHKSGDQLTELQVRILHDLREMGPTMTMDLSKRLGLVACRDVNPSLYDLQKKNLVVKVSDMPVVWQVHEPVVDGGEPEQVQCFPDTDESS